MIGTEKQNLKNTQIVLLTNSAIDQNAELHTEFDALYDYFRHPYIEGNYGYQYTAQDAPLKTIIMCISSDMEALTE